MSLNPDDVRNMAERYAKAWSSHVAEDVASFYEPDGYIVINDGEPIVGHAAFAEMAQSFFDGIPDLVTEMVAANYHSDIQYFARVPIDPEQFDRRLPLVHEDDIEGRAIRFRGG